MTQTSSRRIVLTGVSRGLGRALAQGLVDRGHTIFACSRSASAIAELSALWGPPHRLSVVDVSRDEEVARWAAQVLATGGPPDMLINNAGVINANAMLWQVSAEEFARVLDVNVKGVANVVRHFVPAMVERRRGVIVNLSSGWGRSVSAEVAPYCASKWAVEGLTRALAEELPAGMAAVPLNPGIINTDLLQSCFGDDAASYPDAAAWAKRAVPFLLKIGPRDNGQPLTVP